MSSEAACSPLSFQLEAFAQAAFQDRWESDQDYGNNHHALPLGLKNIRGPGNRIKAFLQLRTGN